MARVRGRKNLPDPPLLQYLAREGHPPANVPHSPLPDRSRGQKLIHTGFNVPLLIRVRINRYEYAYLRVLLSKHFAKHLPIIVSREGKENICIIIFRLLNYTIIDVLNFEQSRNDQFC